MTKTSRFLRIGTLMIGGALAAGCGSGHGTASSASTGTATGGASASSSSAASGGGGSTSSSSGSISASASSSSTSSGAGTGGGGGAGGGSVLAFDTIDFGTMPASDSNHYQVMVLQYDGTQSGGHSQSWLTNKALHATNPNVKLLVYQDVMSTMSDGPGWTSCSPWNPSMVDGMSFPGASANDAWFVHDTMGHKVQSSSTFNHYLMDVGNAAYQKNCAGHAVALALANDFDGVFFDDVGYWDFYKWYDVAASTTQPLVASDLQVYSDTCSNMTPPSPAANQCKWMQALASLTAAAGPIVHAAISWSGKPLLAIGNLGATGEPGGDYQKIVGPIDGFLAEGWTDPNANFAWQLPAASWAVANGKYQLMHTHSVTEAANVFGLAAMLLVADGKASYATSNSNTYVLTETWYGEYCTAAQLGAPMGPYQMLTSGGQAYYRRDFANGTVLANPGPKATGAIALGATYSYATGELMPQGTACPTSYPGSLPITQTSTVTLQPKGGAILLK